MNGELELIQGGRREPAVFDLMDRVEARILDIGGVLREKGGEIPGFPQRHIFTPGLYIRETTAPPGSVFTTMIHKTEHPFMLTQGHGLSLNDEGVWTHVVAPCFGITKVGTRRVFITFDQPLTCMTFHATDLTDIIELEEYLYEDYENPLLGGDAA